MLVSHSSLSEAAQRLERDRERDFFRLLFVIDRARLFFSVPVTNVDWKLTCDCLDEMNYRYADYAFLLGFTATYVLRNRAGRTFLSRFRFPIYAGLVMYDLELRQATPAPALQYWNSICTLDSEVGRLARVLHTPRRFYEVGPALGQGESDASFSSSLHGGSSASFPSWFMADLRYGMQSLLLKNFCSFIFAGSSWRHPCSDNTEVTALVVSNRFFHWRVLESKKVLTSRGTEYNVSLKWLPTLTASDSIRRSLQCRDLIMERSTIGGKLWYRAHFLLLRCFGLDLP
ncbi:hypothetical protein ABL78_2407 [Leptomonas seymouri]|uniref:Uncharacterized protein n=1 Tax=Leptomonas seymouri TaxID=5684 RepID=A0A0N1ILM1_LEPSE|nr:hypothetical protein ABL78_2407 [Leptomonas seymouri]|eukprot:KPI88511.1 hypothetical protein ABL78_2407 [Leptomonas seymouri]